MNFTSKALIFLALTSMFLSSCAKDDDKIKIEIPETISVAGAINLPTNSTFNVEGWSVNGEFSEDLVSNDAYELEAVSPDFGVIYVSDLSDNERLLGLVYPGQNNYSISCSSTVLAMLMKMPVVNSLTTSGKLNLISSIEAILNLNKPFLSLSKHFYRISHFLMKLIQFSLKN